MVTMFKFTGLLVGGQGTPIDDDDPASLVKRVEYVIENGSRMPKFVVSVGDEDGVNLPFRQMRVVLITVNNVNIASMVQ